MELNLKDAGSVLGFALITASMVVMVPRTCTAQGDLLVAPTRVVFEGPKRTAEINLVNVGDKPATYRISLIHTRMSEDGSIHEIESPAGAERFADDLVRFTPRQVELLPRIAQTIRVQLRLPAELDTGEFRSHLLFRAVPMGTAPEKPVDASAPQRDFRIRLTPIFGVTIPVIVRHGKTEAISALSGLKIVPGPADTLVIKGRINRTGNISVYGDVLVSYAPPGGKSVFIGKVAGLAVYTPLSGRLFEVKLTPPHNLVIHGGTMHVVYQQAPADGTAKLAEATVETP